MTLRVLKFEMGLTGVFSAGYAGKSQTTPMDQTARWMKTGGEGIPPGREAENGHFLGLSPRAAALAVMVLLAVVMAASYFSGFATKLHRAVAVAPYPHELAQGKFCGGWRCDSARAGAGGCRSCRRRRRGLGIASGGCERCLQRRGFRVCEPGDAGGADSFEGIEAVHV